MTVRGHPLLNSLPQFFLGGTDLFNPALLQALMPRTRALSNHSKCTAPIASSEPQMHETHTHTHTHTPTDHRSDFVVTDGTE
jgi:hypothetical protein